MTEETLKRGAPRNLTKKFVDSVSASKSKKLWIKAIEPRGLYLLVHPSGVKSFVVRYTVDGHRRNFTIGTYGPMTVEEARSKARKVLGTTEDGRDPASEKQASQLARKNAVTFGQWSEEYLEWVRLHSKRPKNDELYIGFARSHWDSKPLDTISVDDVLKLFQLVIREGVSLPISQDANGRRRKLQEKAKKRWVGQETKSTTANRWLASVRSCLQSAWRSDKIPFNPAMKVKALPENPPRTRVLSDSELKAVINAVATLKDPFVRAAFTLLIETGARRSEVLKAKWEDFDLDAKLWRLPRPKSGRPQVMPIADSTVALLRNLPHYKECPFVIPGRPKKKGLPDAKGRYDLRKPWDDIRTEAKTPDVRIHDLRRTFGLHVARKAGLHVASKLLRHSAIAVTERVYVPLGIEELRKAMDEVSEDRGKVLSMKPKGEQA